MRHRSPSTVSCWLCGILEEIHSILWPGTGQSRLLFFLPAIIPTGRWLGFCCVAMAMASPPGDVRGAEHSSHPACPRAPGPCGFPHGFPHGFPLRFLHGLPCRFPCVHQGCAGQRGAVAPSRPLLKNRRSYKQVPIILHFP